MAVLGSPRPQGGSSTLARRVLDGARAAGHEVVVSACNCNSTVNGPMITYMNRHYCLIGGDNKVRIHSRTQ